MVRVRGRGRGRGRGRVGVRVRVGIRVRVRVRLSAAAVRVRHLDLLPVLLYEVDRLHELVVLHTPLAAGGAVALGPDSLGDVEQLQCALVESHLLLGVPKGGVAGAGEG